MESFFEGVQLVSNFIWGGAWGDTRLLPVGIVTVALLGTGLFFMVGLGFRPLRRLGPAFAALWSGRQGRGDGEITPWQALSTALSGQVGTGNLAGVATAITLGGPGAVFWMWVTAILGMAAAFAESSLAVRFRERHPDGHVHGGPMFYIKNGLGKSWVWLAVLFCLGTLFSAVLTGGMIQANSVTQSSQEAAAGRWLDAAPCQATGATIGNLVVLKADARSIATAVSGGEVFHAGDLKRASGCDLRAAREGELTVYTSVPLRATEAPAGLVTADTSELKVLAPVDPATTRPVVANWIIGAVVAFLVYLVIIGGIKSIGAFAGRLVPIMAVTYVIAAFVVLALNAQHIGDAFMLIFRSAFGLAPVTGGLAGYGVLAAVRAGVARGLFSNEAGQGSAPIAHAAAQTDDPVRQGEIAMLGVFIDTIVICTMTALVILVVDGAFPSGGGTVDYAWQSADLQASAITTAAYAQGVPGGEWIVLAAQWLFAFTTMIGWSYYGEQAVSYLFGDKAAVPFRYIWVGVIFVGALVVNVDGLWLLGDVANASMLFPNVIAILGLSGVVFAMARDADRRAKAAEAPEKA